MSGPYPIGGGPRRVLRRAYVLQLSSQQVGALVGGVALLLVLSFLLGHVVGRARGRDEGEVRVVAAEKEVPPEAPAAEAEAPAAEAAAPTEASAPPPPVEAPAPAPTRPAPAPRAAPTARPSAPSGWELKRYAIVARSIPLADTPAQAARAREEARATVLALRRKGYASARSEEVSVEGGRYIRVVARDITPAGPGVLDENVRKVRADGYPGAFPIAH